jgi:nucleoside-diphosphate-sugar epimerase
LTPDPSVGPALVTGAAGFVGSHVADALLARGVPVRALVRKTTDRRFLDGGRVRLVEGDVCDASAAGEDALARAAEGCDWVVHAAGITQARALDEYARVNAEGSARAARAAVRAGAKRFVLVSSQAAGGPSFEDRPRDETDEDAPVSAYGRSKLDGERLAREALGAAAAPDRAAPELVVVRPPSVYGPRDRAFLELFRLVDRGVVPAYRPDRQQVSLVHARDLAKGIVLAAEKGGAGRTYYLTDGRPTTSAGVIDAIARALGKKPLRLDIPSGMLEAAVWAAEAFARATGRPARITRERLAEWTGLRWTLSDARARAELGYTPTIALEAGIEETAHWYRTAGWI